MTIPDTMPPELPSRSTLLNGVFIFCAVIACIAAAPYTSAQQLSTELFDGASLDGWEVIDRDQQWWTVSDGAITGGSLEDNVPHNTFICTKESFQNFDLTLKIRITGAGGFINSGIQIRSIRVPKSSEMSGYQVDAGDGWWGKLYDESRRNKVVGQAADLKRVNRAIRKDDWNEIRIRTEGSRIRSWINGVAALDYVEESASIPLDGQIGIQVHGGGKALVQVRDIAIERLPATVGAMTWKRIQRSRDVEEDAKKNAATGPLSPELERRGFVVPDGFEVELVASETDGIGKFVTVAFDAQGRMWTMTALEYPVDANENSEASAQLFSKGGKDKVLVFEEPFGKQVSPPKVFAEGLVMPLGILPHKDGVYVQYGNDIRFYRDTNGDGKADTHEVILTGFGVQDSHLFPHQFTRTPGGWILTAQGLFNSSTVRRPGGKLFFDGTKEVEFRHCKLARFTEDGARFEALTAGPNNIWGLTISREGETWLQEANDLGYPIIPFEPGGYYQTGSKDRLRAYQPLMPPTLSPPQMGGTGLSGLALADDRNGWPAPWGLRDAKPDSPRHFYVANPITSRIQMIRATVDGQRYRYEKLPDFLISRDPKFRPVSIQFGPDGSLYVTDWYNKIISHNEVPRNHAERDKVRGRIWRIRHRSQPRLTPTNLSEIPNPELLAHLGSPNACTASLAWQQIVDRQATDLIPKLQELVVSKSLTADKRLGSLWALEGLTTVSTTTLVVLANDANANIRHEAVRIAAAQPRSNDDFLAVAKPLVDDPSPRVRAALGDGLRRLPAPDASVVELMLRLGKAPLPGQGWKTYDREFERYMARWAMELNADAVQQLLDSPSESSIPLENRVLATLSLPGAKGAVGLARLIPKLTRPLTAEETRALAENFNHPEVAAVMSGLLEAPMSRESTLKTLSVLRTDLDTRQLLPSIDSAAQTHWSQAKTDMDRQLVLQIAGAFRLQSLDQEIAKYAVDAATTEQMKLLALRSLRELGSSEFKAMSQIVVAPNASAAVRSAALAALAESPSVEASLVMSELLIDLNYEDRQSVIDRMVTSRNGALALLAAVDDGDLEPDSLSPTALETMRELLPDNELLNELWNDVAGTVRRIVRFSGNAADYVQRPITLSGPFTVETWVRLTPSIGNADGILGRPNVLDMNFYDSTFRVWIASQGDVAVAKRKILPDTWTHCAVTRDQEGRFRIYLNGELSADGTKRNTKDFPGLNIGRTILPAAGTDGSLTEYRVWNVARTPTQIRDNFDRSFSGEELPGGLIQYFDGANWGKLNGKARVESTLEAPKLLNVVEAKRQRELFAKYRQLAKQPGDAAAGKALFIKTCLVCHQQGGRGGKIGPPLDGVGLTGTEALLRNVLTPNAAMEGGYRNFRVLTDNGRVVQGLLVSQDTEAVVLRMPDTADRRIEKSEIERAGFTSQSVMPNGLLDTLTPQDVSNLFTHLHSLTQKGPQ